MIPTPMMIASSRSVIVSLSLPSRALEQPAVHGSRRSGRASPIRSTWLRHLLNEAPQLLPSFKPVKAVPRAEIQLPDRRDRSVGLGQIAGVDGKTCCIPAQDAAA